MNSNYITIYILLIFLNFSSCDYQQVDITADNYHELNEVMNKDVVKYYGYKTNDVGNIAWNNLRGLIPKKGKQIISDRFYYEFMSKKTDDGLKTYYQVYDLERCVYFTVNINNSLPTTVYYGYVDFDCVKNKSGITSLNYHNYSSPMLYKTLEQLKKQGFILKESSLKDGTDILIKDDSKKYFKIVEVYRNSYDKSKINGLGFKIYSKRKF